MAEEGGREGGVAMDALGRNSIAAKSSRRSMRAQGGGGGGGAREETQKIMTRYYA